MQGVDDGDGNGMLERFDPEGSMLYVWHLSPFSSPVSMLKQAILGSLASEGMGSCRRINNLEGPRTQRVRFVDPITML